MIKHSAPFSTDCEYKTSDVSLHDLTDLPKCVSGSLRYFTGSRWMKTIRWRTAPIHPSFHHHSGFLRAFHEYSSNGDVFRRWAGEQVYSPGRFHMNWRQCLTCLRSAQLVGRPSFPVMSFQQLWHHYCQNMFWFFLFSLGLGEDNVSFIRLYYKLIRAFHSLILVSS